MSGEEDIPIEMDKKEAVSELKRQVKEKWQRKFDLTEKAEKIQEILQWYERGTVMERETGLHFQL